MRTLSSPPKTSIRSQFLPVRSTIPTILSPTDAKNYVLWKDPVLSGSVVAGATAAFLSIRLLWNHIPQALSLSVLILTLVSFAWNQLAGMIKVIPTFFLFCSSFLLFFSRTPSL